MASLKFLKYKNVALKQFHFVFNLHSSYKQKKLINAQGYQWQRHTSNVTLVPSFDYYFISQVFTAFTVVFEHLNVFKLFSNICRGNQLCRGSLANFEKNILKEAVKIKLDLNRNLTDKAINRTSKIFFLPENKKVGLY